jgi:hemerythrin
MPIITWTDKLSVNIAEVDMQHKQLVVLINQLHDAMSTGKGKDVLAPVLRSLVAYASTHFATEERLMTQWKYPGLAQHKAAHEAFAQQVGAFRADYEKGVVGLTMGLSTFLRDWLTEHIMGVDQAYAPFLQSKGVH